MRNKVLIALVALVAAALSVAGPAPAQKGPIKIGLITPLTGGLAPNGKDTENGLKLFLEEQGGKIAGREVKLFVEDDEGKPATGLTKARALVEGQGIHLLFGPVSAAIGYAIAPYVDGKKIPTVYAIVAGEDITQLRRDVDAIYAVFSGGDALRFAKQFADSPLKGKVPVIGGGVFTDEHVLRTMGDEVLGVVTALHYSAALSNAPNRKFVAAYQAKYGTVPSYYSEGPYVTGFAVKAAIEAIGGDVENAEKLIAAIRKVDLSESPRGPVKFDDYGNPVQNIYVRKVERVGGKLQNTVIHTFPNVSQFWNYKPDEFLKNPVYSRDVPPCKHCN